MFSSNMLSNAFSTPATSPFSRPEKRSMKASSASEWILLSIMDANTLLISTFGTESSYPPPEGTAFRYPETTMTE